MPAVPLRVRTLLCAVLLLGLAGLPAAASASSTQTMTFEAPKDLLVPETRDGALAELDSLGVRSLRLVMVWRNVAPSANSATKPDFDTTDPAAYDFSRFDAVIERAKQRGWTVLLTVSGPVPRWATASRKDNLTRPVAAEFAQFMTAVGRHYGSQVDQWSIWNEPNQPQFLLPQFDAHRHPLSPKIYRSLYKAGQKGLKAAGLGSAPVLLGETSPVGTGKVVAPLVFLRGMLCLDSHYRRDKSCGKLTTAGYAHHAYTRRTGPTYVPPGPSNVTIGVLSRLTRALDRAGSAGAIPKKLPVYLTEFGIQSVPDTLAGVSLQQQAEFRAISERIAYDNPRVRSFSQYLLRDDDPVQGVPKIARYSGFESGLRTATGKAKPSLAAFRLPLAVRSSGSTASVWGMVRPATGATTATLQVRDGSKAAFKDLVTVTTNARGAFTRKVAYRSGRQFQLVWTAPDGTRYAGTAIRAYR